MTPIQSHNHPKINRRTANPVTLTLGDRSKLKIIDELVLFVTSPRQAASIRCQDLLFPSFGKIEKASRRMDWKPKVRKEKENDLSKKRVLNED